MLAYDRDEGLNALLHYSIKSGKGKSKFRIDNSTGMVYAQKGFEPGQVYELNVSMPGFISSNVSWAVYLLFGNLIPGLAERNRIFVRAK